MDLHEKINVLYEKTIKMFDLTKYYLDEAFQAYSTSRDLENEINDSIINNYERQIEEECLSIILRERPFAEDLRSVTGIFKLVEDIERLSDHAEDVYWCVKNLKKANCRYQKIPELSKMIDKTFEMLWGAYDSFTKKDEVLAQEVMKKDDIIDSLYLEVLEKISDLSNHGENSDLIIYFTLLAKYVERIADHASNIAEWAWYIQSGYYKDKMII